MATFEAPSDSITLAFEEFGAPVRDGSDWRKLLEILKTRGVARTKNDERILDAVWARRGAGRPFGHAELRDGVFEEYRRPRPGEADDDGAAARARAAEEDEARRRSGREDDDAARDRAKAAPRAPRDRFDYEARWAALDASDDDVDDKATKDAEDVEARAGNQTPSRCDICVQRRRAGVLS